ncbi:MAG: TIR domain-containing protein [Bacteroidota bacterium]
MVIPFTLRGDLATPPIFTGRRRRILRNFFTRQRSKSVKERVYISYSHRTDRGFKKFLETWAEGSDFIFIFSNYTSGIDPDSREGRTIKAAITKKMRKADYLLVLVGESTHEDKWVSWEIERAQHPGINLKIAAAKTSQSTPALPELPATGTSWSIAFTKHSILTALTDAGSK